MLRLLLLLDDFNPDVAERDGAGSLFETELKLKPGRSERNIDLEGDRHPDFATRAGTAPPALP